MSTSATILTKPEFYDIHVRKFRSICDMHRVPVGSQEDLRGFTSRLNEDSHFAMDFWAFTGKLSSREGGELSEQRILAIIVEGITGGDIPNSESELKGAVDELAAMLSGVDVQSPLQSPAEPLPFPHIEPDAQSSSQEQAEHDAGLISDAVDRKADSASPPPSAASSPRVVFISEPVDRESAPAPSPVSGRSSSHRAAFTSETVDREAPPTPTLPVRRPSSTRAVFTSEAVDREASPVTSLPSRRSSSSRAVFISEAVNGEVNPAPSVSSMLPPALRAAPISAATDREAEPPSSQLVEALRWLQLSSLELKQHLNEIDQKMSKLDPTLEEPVTKTKTRSAVEEKAAAATAAKQKPVIQDDTWPGPELLASAFGSKWSEPSTLAPLETYAQVRGPHGKALFTVLVLIVAGSTFLLQEYGAPLHAMYGPGIQRVQLALARVMGEKPATTASRTEPESEPETVSLSSLAPADEAGVISTPATRQAALDTSSSSTPSAGVSGFGRMLGQAAVTALSGSQTGRAYSNSTSSRRASTPPPSAPAYNSPPDAASANDASSGDGAKPIDVAPSEMQSYLVLSRVPAYPQAARRERAEGPVLVKAVISKSGEVEDVRVIEGNPVLHSAAADAIYKWRFRPYLVNGQPVQVETTISVDFKPHR
jgi:TonB family protein